MRRRHLFLLALAAAVASPKRGEGGPAEKVSGRPYFGEQKFIEYVAGELPLVLTAPHGGRLKPAALADRKEGSLAMDANTQELARALAGELHTRTGRHAHLIVSHLHRGKLDPNREIKEAAQGDAGAERAWREFHATIKGALEAAIARHGFAFLVDLHGHAHPIARLELGYALSTRQLNVTDADFDRSGVIEVCTLRDLHARLGGSAAALLRGPRSLGALFEAGGLRAVPGPAEPQPEGNPYFNGGYIVRLHTAAPDTAKVDGLQIECPRPGVRDTPENRARFARVATDALTTFLRERYGFDAAAKK